MHFGGNAAVNCNYNNNSREPVEMEMQARSILRIQRQLQVLAQQVRHYW